MCIISSNEIQFFPPSKYAIQLTEKRYAGDFFVGEAIAGYFGKFFVHKTFSVIKNIPKEDAFDIIKMIARHYEINNDGGLAICTLLNSDKHGVFVVGFQIVQNIKNATIYELYPTHPNDVQTSVLWQAIKENDYKIQIINTNDAK